VSSSGINFSAAFLPLMLVGAFRLRGFLRLSRITLEGSRTCCRRLTPVSKRWRKAGSRETAETRGGVSIGSAFGLVRQVRRSVMRTPKVFLRLAFVGFTVAGAAVICGSDATAFDGSTDVAAANKPLPIFKNPQAALRAGLERFPKRRFALRSRGPEICGRWRRILGALETRENVCRWRWRPA